MCLARQAAHCTALGSASFASLPNHLLIPPSIFKQHLHLPNVISCCLVFSPCICFSMWWMVFVCVCVCLDKVGKEGSSVQSLSHVQLFVTPWTAACQASLSVTNSQSLLKLMCIASVMPSNHLILCRPLLWWKSLIKTMSSTYRNFVYFYFLLKYSWFIMYYLYWIAKWFSYIYIYILFKYSFPLWFIIGYWIQFPVLCSKTLLLIHPVFKSLHLLTQTSHSTKHHSLWQPPACSLCLWLCLCFVDRLICVVF